MIFLLAGTSDARELAIQLCAADYPLLASVVTDSAAHSLTAAGVAVRVGRLDEVGMVTFLQEAGATMLVDASHPFAAKAHRTAMAAAAQRGIPYLRFERPSKDFSEQDGVTVVDTYEQAAAQALLRKGSVMLTTGAKTMDVFARRLLEEPDVRLVVRLLPRADNLDQCQKLGIAQKDIIAMQGPFSYDLNRALYKHYGTSVMVTKESGAVGAVDEKVQAARDLGIHVIVIGRPKLPYGRVFTDMDEVIHEVNQRLGVSTKDAEHSGFAEGIFPATDGPDWTQ